MIIPRHVCFNIISYGRNGIGHSSQINKKIMIFKNKFDKSINIF